ncbi:elongation factor P 5-aminopentanone reductase [Clostridium sp. Marseille-P3244]|uniref:elongation factor P 5-aminopentanone reductase n=1 Tax=Clostridium sp. Marseille-P3244 TaxID=1871020 RepID=UPI00092FF1C0|nr:3-oxoacyl-ACP reductase FabG [Clostridium sp. Marseille-P3244]
MSRKNVLITGSSRGIGRSCALAFAQAGYHVFLNCRESVDQLRITEQKILAFGGSCALLPGDVTDPEAVRSMFRQITVSCGGLDVLINNAGIAHFGLLSDMSDREWRRIIDTNLSSAFFCCRAAIPHMVAEKQGKIINISSIWGTSGASCEAAYSASKAGLNGLTRALAKELAPSNIQVNAVSCGVIDTEMNARLDQEERLVLEEEIPAGRFGTPEEVAELVLKLADAPPYMTGQIIGLDGGFI